jgi:hypothetical protein
VNDPKAQTHDGDEVDLDVEEIEDLDLDERVREVVLGGQSVGGPQPGGTSH